MQIPRLDGATRQAKRSPAAQPSAIRLQYAPGHIPVERLVRRHMLLSQHTLFSAETARSNQPAPRKRVMPIPDFAGRTKGEARNLVPRPPMQRAGRCRAAIVGVQDPRVIDERNRARHEDVVSRNSYAARRRCVCSHHATTRRTSAVAAGRTIVVIGREVDMRRSSAQQTTRPRSSTDRSRKLPSAVLWRLGAS